MSYARGDFYVKAVRTGLGDNQTIIPGTAGRDSGGDYSWKPGWISFALVDRGCHNETHSNQFLCVDGISPGPLEGARQRPASQKAGEQRFPVQEFRTELTEISVYSSREKKKKSFLPLCSQRCSLMNRMKCIGPQALSALTWPRSSRSPWRSQPGTPPHLRPCHMQSWNWKGLRASKGQESKITFYCPQLS